jgi:hypothetical protein
LVGFGWKMLEKVGKGWKRLEKVGKGWKRLEKVGKGWKRLEKVGKGWKMLEISCTWLKYAEMLWQLLGHRLPHIFQSRPGRWPHHLMEILGFFRKL